MERVVVTGLGAVTPLGRDAEESWAGMVAGRSGVRRLQDGDAPVRIAGTVTDFEGPAGLPRRSLRRMARFTRLVLAAAIEAVAASGLDLAAERPERIGVEIGNATGSIETIVGQHETMTARGPRGLTPTVIPGAMVNMAACQVAIHFGTTGPVGVPVAACATGLYAVGDAFRRLQRGEVDVVLAGAGESFLHPLAVAAFWRMGALSTRNEHPAGAMRPFAADRDGTVMAEGGALLVLESERHARRRGAGILAEVTGYGLSSDATHIIAPDTTGRSAARAIAAALAEAQVAPAQVDWISAHGTATPLNDLAETRAIQQVFGADAGHVPVSAIKSMTGHTLGAAGAISALAAVLAIRDGVVPPTINLHHPDPALDLDFVPLVARQKEVRVVLSNAFGFGGQNAALVIGRYEP